AHRYSNVRMRMVIRNSHKFARREPHSKSKKAVPQRLHPPSQRAMQQPPNLWPNRKPSFANALLKRKKLQPRKRKISKMLKRPEAIALMRALNFRRCKMEGA